MAAAGYPGDYAKGSEIRGLAEAADTPGVTLFHAGTRRDGDGFGIWIGNLRHAGFLQGRGQASGIGRGRQCTRHARRGPGRQMNTTLRILTRGC